MYWRFFLGLIASIMVTSCSNNKNSDNQISVFCAASLTNVIEEIKSEWEKTHDQKVILNVASSGTLARQIEYGAEADIFLSANSEWMSFVQGLLKINDQPKTVAKNRLVVVSPAGSRMDSVEFQYLFKAIVGSTQKIAIGDPGHVPLGKYTKMTLEHFSVFKELNTRFILTKDARNCLRLVELGEVEYGFVYVTDALSSSKVKIVAEVPESSHSKITYEAILLNREKVSSRLFFDFLKSEYSRKVWKEYGFIY